ncbi:hypothetical protein DITRI_Ditri17bG0087700 [Diplodiscus trichospermus]
MVRFGSMARRSEDWRDNLFTVCVDNLSVKVPKSALWEVFDVYGTVMDVYIGSPKSWHRHRGTTFALVRYRTLFEMQRAVKSGNNRFIDGWQIRVKKASFRWKNRFKSVKKSTGYISTKTVGEDNGQEASNLFRENRSYKDMALGIRSDGFGFKDRGEVLLQEEIDEQKKVIPSKGDVDGFLIDSLIPQDEMEWLNRCAEELSSILAEVKGFMDEWFEDLWPLRKATMPRKFVTWVNPENVPLEAWHPNFFIALASKWGTFMKIDDQTFFRKRFDVAKILILVEDKETIPSSVNARFKGDLVKIHVSVEDTSSAMVVGERFTELLNNEGEVEMSHSAQENVNRQVDTKLASNHEADLDPCIGKAIEVIFGGFSAGISQHKDLDIVVGQDFGNNIGLNESQVDVGLFIDDIHLGSCEKAIVPLSIGINRTLRSSKKGEKNRRYYNGKSENGQKKSPTSIQNIIGEAENVTTDFSDFSIFGDDIAHRNSVIRNKAEATWEISFVLGMVFDKDKNQMIEIFQRLEEEDMGARAN